MVLATLRRASPVLAVVCLWSQGGLLAQDSLPAVRPDTVITPDSLRGPIRPAVTVSPAAEGQASDSLPPPTRPVSPGGALLRSLLIPGWGQARLGRGLAAGFFLTVEGAALGMALKANSELAYLKEVDPDGARQKAQEREDWLVIVGVNHLIAGIEAYVSAYLWDFPGDLQMRPTPYGTAATVTVPFRLR